MSCSLNASVHEALWLHAASFFSSYFQKVPPEAPELELKASYGLVEPQVFELPALGEVWTKDLYAAFDITQGPKDDKVGEHPVHPVAQTLALRPCPLGMSHPSQYLLPICMPHLH